MKFLVAADIHFHNYRSYSRREKGYNSRLLRTVDAFDVMTKHAAKDGDVDAIFLLGDIFHRRGLLDVDVINKAYQCMRRLARVTKSLTILAGNHDQMSKDGQITSLEVFQDIKGVQVILGPTKFEIFGTQFYLHPYTEDVDGFRRQITEWVDEMNALTPRSRYLMTHMGVQGATVGPYEFEPPSPLALEDLLPGAFAKVFMGHYHKRQEFFPKNCPRSKAMYVGSFLQHNHSEEGDPKGFIEVEEPGGAIIHHKTRQPEFFTIRQSNLIPLPRFNLCKRYPDVTAVRRNSNLEHSSEDIFLD